MNPNKPCYVLAVTADIAKWKAMDPVEWREHVADTPQELTDRLRHERMFHGAKIWRLQVIASEVV